MLTSDTQKSLKASHYVRVLRSLCLGTSHRLFYSSTPKPAGGDTEALPAFPGLTEKVSLLSDPCEVLLSPLQPGSLLHLQEHMSAHTFSGFPCKSPPTRPRKLFLNRFGNYGRLTPILCFLSSPGPQVLKLKRLFSAVTSLS